MSRLFSVNNMLNVISALETFRNLLNAGDTLGSFFNTHILERLAVGNPELLRNLFIMHSESQVEGDNDSLIKHFLDQQSSQLLQQIRNNRLVIHENEIKALKSQHEGRWIKWESDVSKLMWTQVTNPQLSAQQKAGVLVQFMFNQDNWKRKSCLALWKAHVEQQLFETLATAPMASPRRSQA